MLSIYRPTVLIYIRTRPSRLCLNASTEGADVHAGGRLFHIRAAAGKKEYFIVFVLQYGTKYFMSEPLVLDARVLR